MQSSDKDGHPGELLFFVLFGALTLFLLTQIGAETKFSPRGKFFAQPRIWPAIGLIGMTVFGAAQLWITARKGSHQFIKEASIWLKAIEYLIWFMAYVMITPIIGYLPATLLFTLLLALRKGYRSRKQILIALATGFAIVVIFKAGLSVKIPGGMIYDYLPSALRNIMIIYF